MWSNLENYLLFWFAAGLLKYMVIIVFLIVVIGVMIVMHFYKKWREQWQFRDGSKESRELDQFILKELGKEGMGFKGDDLQGLLILRYSQFFGHEHGIFDSRPKDRRIRLMRARLASLVGQYLIFRSSDGKYRLTLTVDK